MPVCTGANVSATTEKVFCASNVRPHCCENSLSETVAQSFPIPVVIRDCPSTNLMITRSFSCRPSDGQLVCQLHSKRSVTNLTWEACDDRRAAQWNIRTSGDAI